MLRLHGLTLLAVLGFCMPATAQTPGPVPEDLPVPDKVRAVDVPPAAAPDVFPGNAPSGSVAPGNVAPDPLQPAPQAVPVPEAAAAPTANAVEKWRYKWHNEQWWYWVPEEKWMYWDNDRWNAYDAATYQAPLAYLQKQQALSAAAAASVPRYATGYSSQNAPGYSPMFAPVPRVSVYSSPAYGYRGYSGYPGYYGGYPGSSGLRSGISIGVGNGGYYPGGYGGYGGYGGRGGVSIGFGF